MLIDQIKAKIIEAMKAKDAVAKEVLRVAVGEIQSEQERSGKTLADADAARLVRKIIKSNDESIAVTKDADMQAKLRRENEVLEAVLPRTMSIDQIVAALAPVAAAIKAAGNDGQATGVAMKHLKSTGASVDGKDVGAAVKQIRS